MDDDCLQLVKGFYSSWEEIKIKFAWWLSSGKKGCFGLIYTNLKHDATKKSIIFRLWSGSGTYNVLTFNCHGTSISIHPLHDISPLLTNKTQEHVPMLFIYGAFICLLVRHNSSIYGARHSLSIQSVALIGTSYDGQWRTMDISRINKTAFNLRAIKRDIVGCCQEIEIGGQLIKKNYRTISHLCSRKMIITFFTWT